MKVTISCMYSAGFCPDLEDSVPGSSTPEIQKFRELVLNNPDDLTRRTCLWPKVSALE